MDDYLLRREVKPIEITCLLLCFPKLSFYTRKIELKVVREDANFASLASMQFTRRVFFIQLPYLV